MTRLMTRGPHSRRDPFSNKPQEFWDREIRRDFSRIRREYDVFSSECMVGQTAKSKWDIPLRLPVVQEQFYSELHEVSHRLYGLLELAFRLRFGKCKGAKRTELIHFFALSKEQAKLLPADFSRLASLEMGRPDWIVENGKPKLLEFNVGSCISQIGESSYTSEPYFRSRAGQLTRERFRIFTPHPGMCFVDLILRQTGREFKNPPKVAILDLDFDNRMVPMVVGSQGIPVMHVHPSELRLDSKGGARVGRHEVDYILRDFTSKWLHSDLKARDIHVLSKLTGSKKTTLFTDETMTILGSKYWLGYLWDQLPHFSAKDQALVRKYIPWSTVLRTATRVKYGKKFFPIAELSCSKKLKDAFVLKLGEDEAGAGVFVGKDLSMKDWRDRIEATIKTDSRAVLQEYIKSDLVRLPYCSSQRRLVWKAGTYVISPILIGSSRAGLYFRFSPDKASKVNQGQGAQSLLAIIYRK